MTVYKNHTIVHGALNRASDDTVHAAMPLIPGAIGATMTQVNGLISQTAHLVDRLQSVMGNKPCDPDDEEIERSVPDTFIPDIGILDNIHNVNTRLGYMKNMLDDIVNRLQI